MSGMAEVFGDSVQQPYGSFPSTPTDVAQPTNDSEAMLPGDTTFTRQPHPPATADDNGRRICQT